MNYPLYMILLSFFFLLLSYLLWQYKRETNEKYKNIQLFVIYGLVVLSVFSTITGLSYATEYNNSPPCENIVSNTTNSLNTTTYSYTDSCSNRSVFEPGNYFMIIMIWSGFLLGILIMLGLIVMIGRWFQQW